MIARIWRGITMASKADDYLDYLHRICVPDCQATAGNRGVCIFRRLQGDQAHFLLLSLWESREAIARFAGPEVEKAKLYPDDAHFLLAYESLVTHYEALVTPERGGRAPEPRRLADAHLED